MYFVGMNSALIKNKLEYAAESVLFQNVSTACESPR